MEELQKKKKGSLLHKRADICKLLCVTVLNSTLTQPVRRKEKLCPHRASEEKNARLLLLWLPTRQQHPLCPAAAVVVYRLAVASCLRLAAKQRL